MGSKNPKDYEKNFSSDSFWDKLASQAVKAGKELVTQVVTLYYTWQDSDTSPWAKTKIIGAIGYFISPIDALPDFTPVVGYTDDMAIIAAAMVSVASSIKKSHRAQAKKTVKGYLG